MTQDWIGILLNWLPMIVIVGAWLVIVWRINWRKGGTPYQRDYMEQMKKQNEILDRIATSLEKRNLK